MAETPCAGEGDIDLVESPFKLEKVYPSHFPHADELPTPPLGWHHFVANGNPRLDFLLWSFNSSFVMTLMYTPENNLSFDVILEPSGTIIANVGALWGAASQDWEYRGVDLSVK